MNLARYTRIMSGCLVKVRDYITTKDLLKQGIISESLYPNNIEEFKKDVHCVFNEHPYMPAVRLLNQPFWWPNEFLYLVFKDELNRIREY